MCGEFIDFKENWYVELSSRANKETLTVISLNIQTADSLHWNIK